MKVRIPKQHYELYRRIYSFLHLTLDADAERYPDWELSKTLIDNYIEKPQVNSKNETHLLNDDPAFPISSKGSSTKSLQDLHKQVAGCQRCFLGELRKLYVELPSPAKPLPIMVVIDIPSFYDQTQGRYFTDEPGQLLKKILMSLGLKLEDIYYTAAVKCSYSQEIANRLADALPCIKHLREEIRLLGPKLIFAFGKNTYDLLMEDEKDLQNQKFIDSGEFEKHAGQSLFFHGAEIVFTHHPKDLLISPGLKQETWRHLKKYIPRIEELRNQKHD